MGQLKFCLAALVLGTVACDHRETGVRAHLDDHYPERLSEWQIFQGTLKDLKPNEGVLRYEVTTSLFSNHASKLRTVWMPKGTRAAYSSLGVFNLPVGAILTKTFSFGDRHIETRLYVHKKNGWAGIDYVWDLNQQDALLDVTPQPVRVEWQGRSFDYEIPNVNQCKTCHEGPNDNGPLGLTARMLNRDGQLERWEKAGYLTGVPQNPPIARTDLESRARDYLDVNCASCHVVGGRGTKSGVFLTAQEKDTRSLGICKPATDVPSAFDIVPGKPERSMFLHRMRSLDRKIMMPDVGRSVMDEDGIRLIGEWISSLPGTCPGA